MPPRKDYIHLPRHAALKLDTLGAEGRRLSTRALCDIPIAPGVLARFAEKCRAIATMLDEQCASPGKE